MSRTTGSRHDHSCGASAKTVIEIDETDAQSVSSAATAGPPAPLICVALVTTGF